MKKINKPNFSVVEVSIIIPHYNGKESILNTVSSLLKNTHKNFEIIIVDNGSSQADRLFLQKVIKTIDSRIKVFYLKQNNVSLARNFGIKKAKGKYLMFVDADDLVEDDYIETFLLPAISNNYDVVVGGFKRTNEDGKLLVQKNPGRGVMGLLSILAPWAKLFKKKYLIENNIWFIDSPIGEDIYFNFLALNVVSSDKIFPINYCGYHYVKRNSSYVTSYFDRGVTSSDMINLLSRIRKDAYVNLINKELTDYFLLRQALWFAIYTVSFLSDKEKKREASKILSWMNAYYLNYARKNHFLSFKNQLMNKYGENILIYFALKMLIIAPPMFQYYMLLIFSKFLI